MTTLKEGVVAVPITKDGKILAIWDRENMGKQEKLGWDIDGERKSIQGLMQFVGGMCESLDLIDELAREAREETGLVFSAADFKPSGVGTLIDHRRQNGEIALVGVSIYWLTLDEEMELQLRGAGAVDMNASVELRERDRIIYSLLRDKPVGEYT